MSLYMGIDGGGSNLRVIITDAQLNVMASAQRETANPNVLGYDTARERIQDAMHEALGQVNECVAGVGIGIAGAPVNIASEWLNQVLQPVLPDAHLALASDNEIALVGARAERRGVLLLAGTGSVGFGINDSGESLQVGGWGYLIGDEASGYWMGQRALNALTMNGDADPTHPSLLSSAIMKHLGWQNYTDVIQWLYRELAFPVPEVARLARIVLEVADAGDPTAQLIVKEGADYLVTLAHIITRRLGITEPQFAFAGGILSADTRLSRTVMQELGLNALPIAKYSPVIGAALLAKLTSEKH